MAYSDISKKRRDLRLALIWIFFIAGVVAQGMVAPSVVGQEIAPRASLDDLRGDLKQVQASLNSKADAETLTRAREQALALQAQTEALASTFEPQLANLDARIAELGPASEDQKLESNEVRSYRADLTKQRSDIDAGIRQARLLSVEAAQAVDRVAQLRRERFQKELFHRTAPPYSAEFWGTLTSSRAVDSARWGELQADLENAWSAATADGTRSRFWLLGGIGLFVLIAGRWAGERFIRSRTSASIPSGVLRRAALAFGIVLMFTASTWICARLIFEGFASSRALSDRVMALGEHAIGLLTFSALIAGLGRALLSSQNPAWRVAPLPDAVARALRFVPTLLAMAIFISALIEFAVELMRGSLPLSMAASMLSTALLSAVLLYGLLRVRSARRTNAHGDAEAVDGRRELGLNIGVTLGWVTVVIAIIGLLTGYVALASFITKQAVWLLVLVALLFLLLKLCDHLFTSIFAAHGVAGRALHANFGLPAHRLDQAAVLLSASTRTVLVLVALSALVGADGVGSSDLLTQIQRAISGGINIGELSLSPGVVVRALLVFVIATFLCRLLKSWFAGTYLPTTQLEPGMQVSLTSLVGYAGVILAIVMALSAMGVGLEKVTWIASALSVGIGFGLQAIVQNFVSGLILLVERPVKVGDWVVVGDAEGDVRRINVRTTEIRTGDRVTILVPNSELITKVVRNRTNPIAEGLVKLLIPMPLHTDADMVRKILLELFAAHRDVLKDPAPSVFMDDVSGGRMLFNGTAFVSSPRQAYNVRSEILFQLLQRLQSENIPMYEPGVVAAPR
jgi:small-conductance mechanosensitive channel